MTGQAVPLAQTTNEDGPKFMEQAKKQIAEAKEAAATPAPAPATAPAAEPAAESAEDDEHSETSENSDVTDVEDVEEPEPELASEPEPELEPEVELEPKPAALPAGEGLVCSVCKTVKPVRAWSPTTDCSLSCAMFVQPCIS